MVGSPGNRGYTSGTYDAGQAHNLRAVLTTCSTKSELDDAQTDGYRIVQPEESG